MSRLGATLAWLMRRLVPPIGLRSRIVGALLITSAATLAVAALALLSPLERKLRNQELQNLTGTVQAAVGTFAGMSPTEITDGTAADFQQAVRGLARRAGARVTVIERGPPARIIYSSDSDEVRRETTDDALRAIVTGHTVKSFAHDPDRGLVARVAVPFRTDPDEVGHARFFGVIVVRKSVGDVAGTVRVVKRAFLTAALVGLGIALLLGVGLATGLLSRLRRLRAAALQVAEVGPTADVTVDQGRDEVADLSRALATMQSRLRQQEEVRRAFISTASHELRTPLTSLSGMLELLEEELGDDAPSIEEARMDVGRARAQANRLSRLAADLLDLSRLDAEVPMRSEPVELDEVGRAVMAEFELRSDERAVTLSFGSDAAEARAVGDPGGVARIARILVDNAMRAAPPDSTVRLNVHGENGKVRLEVADSGPGVAPEDRDRIFERFQRGPDSSSEIGGFGLGLAIGRELAERMGGQLELADSRPGARFVLTLDRADG
ncbi:MAG: integral rane sensor signal transduction histidine kinase [Solirubrobacterales bacterium]|nr:integral rane sensor signal transduction histidine kinase [Solirubrobacterales bacterium]